MTKNKAKKTMGNMKNKKSAGMDGIGQDLLLMGTDIIALPLITFINNSIKNGVSQQNGKKQ